jgi:sugar/nucleoside kinase (ribokinase family)
MHAAVEFAVAVVSISVAGAGTIPSYPTSDDVAPTEAGLCRKDH